VQQVRQEGEGGTRKYELEKELDEKLAAAEVRRKAIEEERSRKISEHLAHIAAKKEDEASKAEEELKEIEDRLNAAEERRKAMQEEKLAKLATRRVDQAVTSQTKESIEAEIIDAKQEAAEQRRQSLENERLLKLTEAHKHAEEVRLRAGGN
jgi:hypothetical protein